MKKYFLMLFIVFFTQIIHAQIPDFIPTSGLIAWYPFSGTPNDSSGYGNNGVVYGTVGYGTDRFGVPSHSYLGDADGEINLPENDFPLGNAARSVSLYFCLDSAYIGGGRSLVAWGDNSFGGRWGIYTTDTSIGLEWVNAHFVTPYTPDLKWHNLIITYPVDGLGSSSLKMYFDGVLCTTTYITGPISAFTTTTGQFHGIGGSVYFGTSFSDSWDGYIDDVAVWNRELSACEAWHIAHNVSLLAPSAISGPDSVTVGDSIVLSDSASGGTWNSTNPAILSISATGTITGLTPGTDTVYYYIPADTCYTDTMFFPVTVKAAASETTAVNAITGNGGYLSIYPNPNNGIFEINLVSVTMEDAQVVITNVIGEKVKGFIIKTNTENPLRLQVPPGIYFLSATTKQGSYTGKLIVQ